VRACLEEREACRLDDGDGEVTEEVVAFVGMDDSHRSPIERMLGQ
jgi:hypothetical protein